MTDNILAITGQIIYYGNFYHGVGTWLLLERCTGSVHQYLSGESGVIYLHIELEELIVCLAANALTN